jgi:hypothetical protein
MYRWIDGAVKEEFAPWSETRPEPHPLAPGAKLAGPMLVDVSESHWNRLEHAPETRTYDVFRNEPMLYRKFAETAPTPEGVLAFADRFGLLGGFARVGVCVLQEDAYTAATGESPGDNDDWLSASAMYGFGEPLEIWTREIAAMREAFELWRLLERERVQELGELVTKRGGEVKFKDTRLGPASELAHLTPLQLVPLYLAPTVEARTAKASSITLKVRHNPAPALRSMVSIDNLVAALWHQFAQSTLVRHEWRHCEGCGQLMEISKSATGRRADARTHSGACRNLALAARKRKARDLAASGLDAKTIAEQIGAKEASVAGWIKQQGGRA